MQKTTTTTTGITSCLCPCVQHNFFFFYFSFLIWMNGKKQIAQGAEQKKNIHTTRLDNKKKEKLINYDELQITTLLIYLSYTNHKQLNRIKKIKTWKKKELIT